VGNDRRYQIACLLLGFLTVLRSNGAEPNLLLSPAFCAENLRFAVYEKLEGTLTTNLIGTFKASRVGVDHEKRGFFKIALLPFLALHDVEVVLSEGATDVQQLRKLAENLRQSIGNQKAAEIHGLRLLLAGHESPLLTADILRIRGDHFDFKGAIVASPSGEKRVFPSAVVVLGAAKPLQSVPETFSDSLLAGIGQGRACPFINSYSCKQYPY
jgi:hypothetical protein